MHGIRPKVRNFNIGECNCEQGGRKAPHHFLADQHRKLISRDRHIGAHEILDSLLHGVLHAKVKGGFIS